MALRYYDDNAVNYRSAERVERLARPRDQVWRPPAPFHYARQLPAHTLQLQTRNKPSRPRTAADIQAAIGSVPVQRPAALHRLATPMTSMYTLNVVSRQRNHAWIYGRSRGDACGGSDQQAYDDERNDGTAGLFHIAYSILVRNSVRPTALSRCRMAVVRVRSVAGRRKSTLICVNHRWFGKSARACLSSIAAM